MIKLQELKARRTVAKVNLERLSHTGGNEFWDAIRKHEAAHDAYMTELRHDAGTPPVPLPTYNGMPPLSGPHESTHKRFPPLVSCHEFEQSRARTAMIYLRWFACAIATVVGTVLVVAALLYAAGA